MPLFESPLAGFTEGSVLFVGPSEDFAEDNTHLFWDDGLDLMAIGSNETSITIAGGPETIRLSVHGDSMELLLGLHEHGPDPELGAHMLFARSRGSEASEAVVLSGDELGEIQFYGHDGTDYALAARIRCEVDGTPGSGDMPGRLVFLTTPDASESPAERMRIAQSGLVTIGTGGTFTLASAAGDLGLAGDLEVDGQSRFDGVIGWSTAPISSTIFAAVSSSATIVNGMDIDITASPGIGTLSAVVMNFSLTDEATHSGALTTVTGINVLTRFHRTTLPGTTHTQKAINIQGYGVQSGTTINAAQTYDFYGLQITALNAGANISNGTFTLTDIRGATDPTGYTGGSATMRHYFFKAQADCWIIDSEPFFWGTGEDCSITYDGTNWIFDIHQPTTAIVFNESSADVDFRVESNGNANGLFIDAGNDRVGIMTATTFATLTVNGGIAGNVRTITGTSNQLTGADFLVVANSAGGNVSMNLPPAANIGQIITIKKSSASNTVTVTCDSGDNISGDADDSVTLPATLNTGRTYIADGANTWYRIDAQAAG